MAFLCSTCNASFSQKRNFTQHQIERHQIRSNSACRKLSVLAAEDASYSLFHVEDALQGYLHSYQLKSKNISEDALVFLNGAQSILRDLCFRSFQGWSGIKLFMSLSVTFTKDAALGEVSEIDAHFNCPQHVLLRSDEVERLYTFATQQIMTRLEEFVNKGSGWTVKTVQHLDVHTTRYQPLRASSYQPLPPALTNKKAILNIQNSDDKCFMWSVLASMHPVSQNAIRVTKYKSFQCDLNFTGIPFPVQLPSIPKFETQNSISVNVFGFEDGDVIPLFISKSEGSNSVDLMLYLGHYSLIKNLDKLLSDQRRCNKKLYFCRRCLIPQYTNEKLRLHNEQCMRNELAKVKLPRTDVMCFKSTRKMLRAPYVVYGDFECILPKIATCQQSPDMSYTEQYQKHEPCSFGFVDVLTCCSAPVRIGRPVIYRGTDAVYQFLEKLIAVSEEHQRRLDVPKRLSMSEDNWRQFRTCQECIICEKQLNVCDKVKDHCHICGAYRGAAHSKCNIDYRITRDVTVVFHNLRRYDGILIMNQIAIICNNRGLEIDCLPRGLEDYLSFAIKFKPSRKRTASNINTPDQGIYTSWRIRFIDSLQFLSCSLDRLVSNLKQKGISYFPAFLQTFGPEKTSLLLRKGIYCYDYMDSHEKFSETKLPKQECFYSALTEQDITPEEYQHAQTVWSEMAIETIGEYHDLYLTTDVVLLCDVFEQFRSFALQNYRLDPIHYFTLPGFSWDACLKYTGVQLELLKDAEMYTLLERGIRGGISIISHRHAKANNHYLPDFDPTILSSFILYLDANNLYGWSLIQKLPLRNFRWMSALEINAINWATVECDGDVGWILEVDLEYPESLHDKHNEYPLAPESFEVTPQALSEHARQLNIPDSRTSSSVSKLIPNLYPKTHYVIHCKNLKQYLNLGMKLTKTHRVIAFYQSNWMAAYINFNTEQRKHASNEFEKDLFKLLNNSTFGKSMENVRKYVDVKLVTTSAKLSKLSKSSRYQHAKIFDNNLVAVLMRRASVNLCKPIYIGFSVLDLSKSLMYDFHYGYMKTKFGPSCKLLLTDTDSLCYSITCADVYEELRNDLHLFDTSNYPSHHPLHSHMNTKVVGVMKDETGGEPIAEFIGLRAKMYSMMTNEEEKKRAKGVKKLVTEKYLRHEMYKQTLFQGLTMRHEMKMIRKESHLMYSIIQNKVSLSAYDDKRYLLDDGISSFAYGHYRIREEQDK